MTDRSGSRLGYPSWVPVLAAVPPVFFALISVVGSGDDRGPVAVAVTVAVLPWLVEAVRRVALPPVVFAAWVVTPIALLNLAGGAVDVDLSGEVHNQFTLMLLIWLVGETAARAPWRHVVAVPVAAVAVMVGRGLVDPTFGHSWAFWAGGAGVALLTGFLLRRQQETLSALREAQAALAEESAARERQRIAREVHDVVAHTLTVTLMHVSAARRALERDAPAAREALGEAETLARRSLADVRRLVGLLRTRDEATETRALPDASDLAGLLDSYRAAGVTLDVATDGALGTLPPATGLALYRILQEALSNAVAHAPGRAVTVRVHAGDDDVEVVVANPLDGRVEPRPGGLGLVGMRERVALLGGRFAAAERDGRWVVEARFPRESAVTAAEAPA